MIPIEAKRPVLLDASLQPVRVLNAEDVDLVFNSPGVSQATIRLPHDEPEPALHSFVEVFYIDGSAGVFRVSVPSQDYVRQQSIVLRHGIDTLADSVYKAQLDFEGTVSQLLSNLLSYQTTKVGGVACWQLGTCEDNATVKYSINYNRLSDLLSQIEQNNRYSGGGYWMAMWSLEGLLKAAIGLISAIILIIPLFGKRTVAGSPYAFLNSPWFILPILIVMIGVIIVGAASHTKSEYIIYGQTELAKFSNRIYHHLMMFCLQRPECAMDIRIYRHQDMIPYYEKNENVFRPGGPIARSTWTKAGPLDVLADGISVFTILIAYLFVCFKALGGAFGIGEVARYVGVITALSGSLMGLFNELGILRNNKKQLDTLYEFLDLPNRMYQGSLTTEKRSDRQYEVVLCRRRAGTGAA